MSELPAPEKKSVLLIAGEYEDRVLLYQQEAEQLVRYSAYMNSHVNQALSRTARRGMAFGAVFGALATAAAYFIGLVVF